MPTAIYFQKVNEDETQTLAFEFRHPNYVQVHCPTLAKRKSQRSYCLPGYGGSQKKHWRKGIIDHLTWYLAWSMLRLRGAELDSKWQLLVV